METLNDYNLQDNKKLTTISFEDEDTWLILRTKGIGGSDIGAILGINPHSSPLKIYKQKVEGYKEDLSDNIFIKKGKVLEDLILTKYVKPYIAKLGYEVGKPQFMIVNSDYPFFRANVDGIAYKKGEDYRNNIIVEIKWVSEWSETNWYKPEYCGIPASYYAQVQLYMAVTGARSALVCALFDKSWEMNYFVIPRDEIFIANMITKGRDFYQNCMLMRMPPIIKYDIDKEDTVKVIKSLDPKTEYIPNTKMSKYIKMYLDNGEKLKKAEAIQSQLKDLILDLHTKGFCPDDSKYKVKTSVVKSHRFNTTKFKEDNEDLYEQYCEDNESPRLIIK